MCGISHDKNNLFNLNKFEWIDEIDLMKYGLGYFV